MCTIAMQALPGSEVFACNVNAIPERVQHWQITSVPCLVIARHDQIVERMYAFPSVDAIYARLKQMQQI